MDVELLQQESDVRKRANRMKAGSMDDTIAGSASSMKRRLEQQLSRCPALEVTLCLAQDFMS